MHLEEILQIRPIRNPQYATDVYKQICRISLNGFICVYLHLILK